MVCSCTIRRSNVFCWVLYWESYKHKKHAVEPTLACPQPHDKRAPKAKNKNSRVPHSAPSGVVLSLRRPCPRLSLAIGLANLLDWPLDWAAPAIGLANLLDWLARELGNSGSCICKLVGLGALLYHSPHRRQLCNRAVGVLDCWIDIRWPILYCMNVMLFCHTT